MMNQNHLFPNGSPSSIIDSIQISSSNPTLIKAPSSQGKDFPSAFQQSPSTQHTYSSVDGNSNSKYNNSLNVKGFSVNDNNYKITTQLVDSIMPGNYSGSTLSPMTSQFPSSTQSQSISQSYISNSGVPTTTPFQINSLLSMATTNVGASISTNGESPHPEANSGGKQYNPLSYNANFQDSKGLSSTTNGNIPSSQLSQFFKNQGYSFSTVTSPSSNQQPLQSLSFHHQASYQGNSNSNTSPKIPASATSDVLKNDILSRYSKETIPSSTINLQQQSTSPYSMSMVGDNVSNQGMQNKQEIVTQQLLDVQKAQQQLASMGISTQSYQPYLGLGGYQQQPYLGSSINSLLSPKREGYASMVEQNNQPKNTLGITQPNILYHQGSSGQLDDKLKQYEPSYTTTPTAEELINKYNTLRQANQQPAVNTSPIANNQASQQPQPISSLQPNNFQSTSHFQSLPSLVPGQPSPLSTQQLAPNSSFIQNNTPPPLSYQTANNANITESPISKKYENIVPTVTITTPLRKDSAPITETYALGAFQKNQNEINANNLSSPHSGRHSNYKYQSMDQNSIQKALNGISPQPNFNQAPTTVVGNQSPTPTINQVTSNYLGQIVNPQGSSNNYKQSIYEDMPFQATSPYLGNHIVSVQKPYIIGGGNNNTQNNSLSSGGISSNRQSEADNLTGLNDSIMQGGSGNIGVQKIPSLQVQSNDLSNQFRATSGSQIEDQPGQKVTLQQQPPQKQTKDVFQLYQTIMQGAIPNAQKITNNSSFPSPSQGFGQIKEQNIEPQQPSSARGTQNSQNPYVSSQQGVSQSAQKPTNQQQIYYKITPPSIPPSSQAQNNNQSSQPNPNNPNGQNQTKYQFANNQKQNNLPYIPKIQQQSPVKSQQVFESGQQINQIGNRPRGSYTVVDSQSQPFITYKNPKQSNNYKQKIWQNILQQRKNKMNSFHSPVREKQFYGNQLNASADDFCRQYPPQLSPQRKPGQQGFIPTPTAPLGGNGQQPGLQIGYNQYGQPINCIANSKFGKPQNQEQQQQPQVQYITYVNQNGQKIEQKVLIKSPNQQQYNMNNASFPNPTFGLEQKGYLEQYPSNRQSQNEENPPKINLEIVNNHSAPNENIFYGDQKAMTFSKVSGNSTNSQNSGQNSPAFMSSQNQKSHSPSGKKMPASQFAVIHDQQDPTKKNFKYDSPDSVISGGSQEIQDPRVHGNAKENLNKAMRMSFGGGEQNNENKVVQI